MEYRICTHCKEQKPLSDFHKCRGFKQGVYPKCKECRKYFTRLSYEKRKNKIYSYTKKYRKTEAGKRLRRKEYEKLRGNWPEKYKANYLFNNAIRDGRVVRQPCELCGAKFAQGHHFDYKQPLVVRWLCKKHHQEIHSNNN